MMTSLKTIALALAAVTATTTAASAYNAFPSGENFAATSNLNLSTVTAEAPGVVEIYDFRSGVRGALLGSEEVRAGANTNVRINLGLGGNSDILAVLKTESGQEVLVKDYDVLPR